jgi:hypothetical protein
MVLDMKRMNRILEVNETARSAIVEAGASQGMLQAYLRTHHPGLKHSIPDAPPIATIAGNVLIHGSKYLPPRGPFRQRTEWRWVPTGEVAKIVRAISLPVSRAPPDLAGLSSDGDHRNATKSLSSFTDRPQNAGMFVVEDRSCRDHPSALRRRYRGHRNLPTRRRTGSGSSTPKQERDQEEPKEATRSGIVHTTSTEGGLIRPAHMAKHCERPDHPRLMDARMECLYVTAHELFEEAHRRGLNRGAPRRPRGSAGHRPRPLHDVLLRLARSTGRSIRRRLASGLKTPMQRSSNRGIPGRRRPGQKQIIARMDSNTAHEAARGSRSQGNQEPWNRRRSDEAPEILHRCFRRGNCSCPGFQDLNRPPI